jgi:hypothetical protein
MAVIKAPWTDIEMSNGELINKFWVNWAEWIVHKQETQKIIYDDTKSVATEDIIKTFVEEKMPTATDGEVKNFIESLNNNS